MTKFYRSKQIKNIDKYTDFNYKISKIKKYKNNDMSYTIEEYSEYEHKFVDTDYDTNSENSLDEKLNNSSDNFEEPIPILTSKPTSMSITPTSMSIPITVSVNSNNIKDELISSSFEEDTTSYFNIITKKNLTENLKEDDYLFI